jgi:hypothetical protein
MIDTTYDPVASWDDLMPDGAIRYYEGDDPEGFAVEMRARYSFDVTETFEDEWSRTNWEEHRSFFIPAGLVGEIYGSSRWPLGS